MSQTQQPVGAVWIRLMIGEAKGYGYINDQTPELSIAMLPGYRGLGLGTRLMTALIEAVRETYPALSLSVSADNPARRLYERLGFETVKVEGDSMTMQLSLKNQR
jgi:ribosomal protein S18 acetylase RimI-like enzyme